MTPEFGKQIKIVPGGIEIDGEFRKQEYPKKKGSSKNGDIQSQSREVVTTSDGDQVFGSIMPKDRQNYYRMMLEESGKSENEE